MKPTVAKISLYKPVLMLLVTTLLLAACANKAPEATPAAPGTAEADVDPYAGLNLVVPKLYNPPIEMSSVTSVNATVKFLDGNDMYNNIWMNVYTQVPLDTTNKQRLDLRLATDNKGWLGSGMDDIYEHRILITHTPQRLTKPGVYKFRLENIMREDPLKYVMNVGIRVEKVKG